MDFNSVDCLHNFTVGDGLVSQIPALLIAISAGFIVTRVNGDSDNMGQNIMSQLLSNSFVIIVTCVLAKYWVTSRFSPSCVFMFGSDLRNLLLL